MHIRDRSWEQIKRELIKEGLSERQACMRINEMQKKEYENK